MNLRIAGAAALFVLVLVLVVGWATDFVTLQGEWTIYTAGCVEGEWQGSTCSGRMTAAARYRFRALKAHREVLFWTAGDTGPSGRFSDCEVQDGRTWSCPANADASHTITRSMAQGLPQAAPAGALHVHRVPKWKWEALRRGLPVGRTALD